MNATASQLNWPALDSLDLGELISPDGRAAPLVPQMQVVIRDAGSLNSGASSSSSSSGSNTSSKSSPLSELLPSLPDHFGARVAVGAIAVVVILIVVWRIVAPPLPV